SSTLGLVCRPGKSSTGCDSVGHGPRGRQGDVAPAGSGQCRCHERLKHVCVVASFHVSVAPPWSRVPGLSPPLSRTRPRRKIVTRPYGARPTSVSRLGERGAPWWTERCGLYARLLTRAGR